VPGDDKLLDPGFRRDGASKEARMKASVIVFPGSNCDRDAAVALEAATSRAPAMVWHGDAELPKSDLIVLPGGFSYGDYLRSGAMAAHSPVMREVIKRAKAGTPVLGICNGFQVLTEARLLPGVLMRNATLKFICKDVHLRVERTDTRFTGRYEKGQVVRFPIAHKDGCYFADDATLARLEGEALVAFRYCTPQGEVSLEANPNGSRHNIAGIYNETGTVLGLMPHPERLADPALRGTDGAKMFKGLVESLAA
jgi:phosphoribosylformylglycinamidine synthase I